jgi:hypothetical protein
MAQKCISRREFPHETEEGPLGIITGIREVSVNFVCADVVETKVGFFSPSRDCQH